MAEWDHIISLHQMKRNCEFQFTERLAEACSGYNAEPRLSSTYNREPYSEIISWAHMTNTALWGDTFNPDSINGDQADSHVLPEYVPPHSQAENCVPIYGPHRMRSADRSENLKQRGDKHSVLHPFQWRIKNLQTQNHGAATPSTNMQRWVSGSG